MNLLPRNIKNNENENEKSIKEMKSLISENQKKYFITLGLFSLILILITFFVTVNNKSIDFVSSSIVILFFSFIFATWIPIYSKLSPEDYYKFSGTLDNNGNHKCVSCGHKGIYRSKIYRTNIIICKCSKCKYELFCEKD